jgi:hypothetical protein
MASPYDPQRQQPPQQYPPQGYYQQPPPPACAGPRRAVTRAPMPVALALFHWTMIFCTCGLWWPVYAASKRSRKTVTTWQ